MVDRRKARRLRVTADVHAKVKAFLEAHVMDFSESGALLEVDHPLLPKAVCDLRLTHGDENLVLHGTVRRCRVAGHVFREGGVRVLTYQAALEFNDSDREMARHFAAHLGPEPKEPNKVGVSEDE